MFVYVCIYIQIYIKNMPKQFTQLPIIHRRWSFHSLPFPHDVVDETHPGQDNETLWEYVMHTGVW